MMMGMINNMMHKKTMHRLSVLESRCKDIYYINVYNIRKFNFC